MNLEIIPVGWFAIIVGILVVVASGAFLVVWKIKSSEYPSFKKYKEAQLKLPAVEASLSVKEAELESIRNEFATLSVQNEANRKEKEKYDEWERQIKESFAELDSQELSIKEMQERKKKAVDDLLEKEKLLNQTNAQVEEGAKKIQEQTDILKKLEKNQKELKKVDNELNLKNKKLTEIKDQLKSIQGNLSKKEKELATVEEKLNNAKRSVEDLKAEAKRLEKLLESYGNDVEKRSEETEKFRKDVTNAIKALENVATNIGETAGLKLPTLEERLEDFTRWEIKTDPRKKPKSKEESSLQECQTHFRNKGFVYSDRVLRSFHTSLKINEHSAITVLSGISGTGKSQLPRLYSEAMGIHFLSLPVQPRWDSPQDLLGFYNYVENRFKATPLSRALRQFDRFSNDAKAGNLKDEMLLVLLDEMNLARVEYYFSEFLSRLENREKALENDETYRRKCEIPIEAGPHNESSNSTLRTLVYPGFNVLFVGTMNEDESTLSLSDKVLDRANVLRFGKPDKLQVAGGSQLGQSLDKISFSNWVDWLQKPFPEDSDWGQKLHSLNKNLDGVGKAFGHRVFKGILSYMANYPDQTNKGHKHAFADQLEVKILPKLRGLEMDNEESRDLISLLKSLIEETEDNELLIALEESDKRAQKRGFFSFTGVQR